MYVIDAMSLNQTPTIAESPARGMKVYLESRLLLGKPHHLAYENVCL